MLQIEIVRRAESLGLRGLTRAEVNRLFKGHAVNPKLSTLRQLAHVLDVTLGDLIPQEDSRMQRQAGTTRVPRAVWARGVGGFDLTGGPIVVPSQVLPDRPKLLAVEVDLDVLLVVDPEARDPRDGALVVLRAPSDGEMLVMRAFRENGDSVRYQDQSRYVFGDAGLCAGEVVARIERVRPTPGAGVVLPEPALERTEVASARA